MYRARRAAMLAAGKSEKWCEGGHLGHRRECPSLSFLKSEESGSQWTRRWREMDSNFPFRAR